MSLQWDFETDRRRKRVSRSQPLAWRIDWLCAWTWLGIAALCLGLWGWIAWKALR